MLFSFFSGGGGRGEGVYITRHGHVLGISGLQVTEDGIPQLTININSAISPTY